MPAVGYALVVLLHVLSPAVGCALLFFCTCSFLFTRCGSALFCPLWVRSFLSSITVFWTSGEDACSQTVLCPRPIFWLLVIRIIHLFVFTQSAGLSCARFPASLFASASVSPRERRTHTVFAVWCLGLSRACVVSTSCSPVHVLTHVFSSTSRAACVWWSPSTTCSDLSSHFGMVVKWPLLCVAGNTSSLEPQPRRSISQTANCTSRQALLCLVSRDRPQWSSPSRPCAGGHPSLSSILSAHDSHVATLHESALSERLRVGRSWFVAMVWLSASELKTIDRSACLVEPVAVGVLYSSHACACAVPRSKHVQRRVRSLLANVLSARPC